MAGFATDIKKRLYKPVIAVDDQIKGSK